MFDKIKTKLRNEIVNNEKITNIFSDNAYKLAAYARSTNDIKEEIACLEIIFDDEADDILFAGNWRRSLLEAYYVGGYINSPEAIELSLRFIEEGVETVINDKYVPKVYSLIYCSLLSSNNPEYIKIAKELKSKTPLVESIITNYESNSEKSGGCYVATCVYGSYDCPPVWTLRRFRDNILAQSIFGRMFIKLYYAASPTAVKLFGNQNWFHKLFKSPLDKLVEKLQENGVPNTPYDD